MGWGGGGGGVVDMRGSENDERRRGGGNADVATRKRSGIYVYRGLEE